MSSCKVCNELFERRTQRQCNPKTNLYCRTCINKSSSTSVNGLQDIGLYQENNRNKKLFPDPDIYEHTQNRFLEHYSIHDLLRHNESSTSLSKRPLRCPYRECRKYISGTCLESHFRYEHNDIQIVKTYFNSRNGLNLRLWDATYDIPSCFVLFKGYKSNETIKTDSPEKVHSYPRVRKIEDSDDRPIIALLIAKLSHPAFINNHNNSNEDNIQRQNPSSVKPHDRMVIWLASNIATPYNYTVAISSRQENIRTKYYGSIPTLEESPRSILNHGKGLILTHFHLAHLSNRDISNISLDVVIHHG